MVRIENEKLIIEIDTPSPEEVLDGINLGICNMLQTLSETEDLYYNADLFDAMFYLIELQKALITTRKAESED